MTLSAPIPTSAGPRIRLRRADQPLRIGFVPLCDCAPLVVAATMGFFAAQDLRVDLVREVGWATVRDKLAHGDIDAAHALAGLPFAMSLGLGCVPTPSLTGLVLNLQGNAITLSKALWKEGVRDAVTLGDWFRSERRREPLTFGVVFPVSSHRFLLEKWLLLGGLLPERDVRFVVAPPPQMPAHLKAGHLAGFCAGEPWNSVVVQARDGWCPATSADLAPEHPEKVLAVRTSFAQQQPERHLRLIASVLAACRYCADPVNHEAIAALLAERRFVNAPVHLILRSFGSHFDPGLERPESPGPFTLYHPAAGNAPTPDRGEWVLRNCLNGTTPDGDVSAFVQHVFRQDLHDQARAISKNPIPEPVPIH